VANGEELFHVPFSSADRGRSDALLSACCHGCQSQALLTSGSLGAERVRRMGRRAASTQWIRDALRMYCKRPPLASNHIVPCVGASTWDAECVLLRGTQTACSRQTDGTTMLNNRPCERLCAVQPVGCSKA
jgi:hypothetical protein